LQTKARILAVAAALILTGMIFVVARRGVVQLLAWINGLSARELSIVRALCLFAPIILICLGVGLRRNSLRRVENSLKNRSALKK